MGDRNNPIKFGPEWLRNLARERSAGSSSNNQNVAGSSGTGPGTAGASGGGTASSGSAATGTGNTANAGPKVLLAKLRYGREEMLALYDRTSEAPSELRTIDILYQPRGKPPVALNNSFDDDMRDPMRGSTGGISAGERFGLGRGTGRGMNIGINNEPGREVRGRGTRLALLRQTYGARGVAWHPGLRMPGYSGGAEDEPPSPMRSWNNGSNGGNAAVRNSGDLTEWAPNKMFRNKRPGSNTNWRQSTRDDGEEWRSSESLSRPRTSQQDKWERDWGDRPTQDKPQWNNRRTWVGGDTQNNDDNLPEWATDGAEACGGTFDSSGAFHGYSNDDSNLPKNQETPYALTRSNTHGSFARSKTMEEGSDEWWASEKAKKLSPKRFDASDIKFKKLSPKSPDANATASSSAMLPPSKEENLRLKTTENSEASAAAPETPESNTSPEDGFKKSVRFSESKTFDSLMRSGDINLEEPNDRGNFQSVMITPNNSLRQKHQNIVQPVSNTQPTNKQTRRPSRLEILKMLQNPASGQTAGSDHTKQQQTSEEKIVEDLMELTLDERKPNQSLPVARGNPLLHPSTASMSAGMSSVVNSTSKMSNPAMQLNMSSPMQLTMNAKSIISSAGMQSHGMQTTTPRMQMQQSGMQIQSSGMQMQTSGMELQSPGVQMQSPGLQMQSPGMQMQSAGLQMQSGMQMQGPGMQMQSPGLQMQSSGMQMQSAGLQMQSGMQMQSPGMPMQSPGIQMQSSGMQMPSPGMPGITNSALNASLGLPHGLSNNTIGQSMGLPLQGPPAPVLPNQGMTNSGMNVTGMHTAGGMPSFQSSAGMQGMSSSNVANNSLFHGQNTNNASMQSSGDIPMPNHGNQNNMYPMHGLQHSAGTFAASIYGNMMPQSPAPAASNSQDLADQWYYEDPKQIIQGPFSSKDMYTWYSAGFFSPSLMVRRACDAVMRPLASYGPVVPFAQMDMLSYPMSSGFDSHNQGPQQGLGLDVVNMSNMNDTNSMDSMQFGTVGMMANQPYGQQQMVDSLWSQPTNPSELMWMQQAMNSRNTRVNNLPMFFWDQQPSAIGSNALLPEEIAKEMKTEDQILAQLRASQNLNTPQNMHFRGEPPAAAVNKTEESYPSKLNTTPRLEELHKLIQEDTLQDINSGSEPRLESQEPQVKSENAPSDEQNPEELNNAKSTQAQNKPAAEAKVAKQAKSEAEKSPKNKDSNNTKTKSKKTKDDKKEDSVDFQTKEDDISKLEKRSEDQSPTKIKKEEKPSKKDQEKEKKDWIKEKDGFTVVKGVDKSANKDIKKKAEEVKAAEDAERKRKEEERMAAEEEKKKKQADVVKKQQEIQQQQQQRQASESVNKKAPWSAVTNQANLATSKEGLTLSEIQRLEREKKLEQMKEQQQMMQIIAQQQAAALAREQEMQAGLGWAKKKGANTPGQSLSEIQAEARKQAAAAVAAAAAAHVLEDAQPAPPPAQSNHLPWGSAQNGGGFWDTQPNQPIAKPQVSSPQKVESSKKKKLTLSLPAKKETSPAAEFETWCTTILASWSTKIDVPTFVGFLKDIESPYEVKDYVKCYLGESKDTGDFARQFLERRSKLLRVGMVTPSDDLCSPALAVNPRTNSGSEYQEVKGKGKKTKKNKMLKVDARILGFSVTASEDRINVGDIDSV